MLRGEKGVSSSLRSFPGFLGSGRKFQIVFDAPSEPNNAFSWIRTARNLEELYIVDALHANLEVGKQGIGIVANIEKNLGTNPDSRTDLRVVPWRLGILKALPNST